MNQGFGSLSHLAQRFAASLWPGGPRRSEDAWACSFLTAGEQALWAQMSGPDRRHGLAVARRLLAFTPVAEAKGVASGPTEAMAAVPAALLHDVGKVASGLGPGRRAVATILALAAGRARVARGSGAMARYLRHDALGADLLAAAGSNRLTVAWAREHHLPADRWSVPRTLGLALKAADDDQPGAGGEPANPFIRPE